jgi:hypothetical protein
MKEQISEDFFCELWCNVLTMLGYKAALKYAKNLGYIKQSSEEEIREQIENYKNNHDITKDQLSDAFLLALKLIEILDNKAVKE